MSIIIRLQNLPLSAKSGDIRRFFGGLRIPEGGVHIAGGEKGDAFILFTSDEDARLAMKKDGGRIKDTRIKLFLSSYMEMKHEIERITNCPFPEVPLPIQKQSYPKDVTGIQLSDRKEQISLSSRSRSPYHHRERVQHESNHRHRSKSPLSMRALHDAHSFQYRNSRERSRSPVMRQSLSPVQRSFPSYSRRSKSPYSVSQPADQPFTSYTRAPESTNIHSAYPVEHNQAFSKSYDKTLTGHHVTSEVRFGNEFHNSLQQNSEFTLNNPVSSHLPTQQYQNVQESWLSTKEGLQADLERRITEAMAMHQAGIEHPEVRGVAVPNQYAVNDSPHSPAFSSHLNIKSMDSTSCQRELPATIGYGIPSGFNTAERQPQDINISQSSMFPIRPAHGPEVVGVNSSNYFPTSDFYVTISGLDPLWSYENIHSILKGIFISPENIKWEIDDRGFKTGTAFVKLLNREDFLNVLDWATFVFDGRRITVSECPSSVYEVYFPPCYEHNIGVNRILDLCYMMKGLPFSATYDDVVNFFHGLEVEDVYIIYGPNGKATGIGYVSFTNPRDFEAAFSQHMKKIGHRYIELIACSKADVIEAKRVNGDLNMRINDKKRPLCALLTGLPPKITTSEISSFFFETGSKPDAIHLTLNDKHQPNGRAFVEFTDFHDFEAALKRHRNYLGEHMICVKQILYEEMLKILDTQKAKHDFLSKTPNRVQPDLPEKVPYLWEPPDSNDQFHRSSEMHYRNNRFKHDNFREIPSKSNMQRFGEFQNSKRFGAKTTPPVTSYVRTEYKKAPAFEAECVQGNCTTSSTDFSRQVCIDSSKETNLQESYKQQNDSFARRKDQKESSNSNKDNAPDFLDGKGSKQLDSYRALVKFEMKNKRVVKDKTDHTFNEADKIANQRKLSKLSPDRRSADQTGMTTKDGKKDIFQGSDTKSNKSLEKGKERRRDSPVKSSKTHQIAKDLQTNISHNRDNHGTSKREEKIEEGKALKLKQKPDLSTRHRDNKKDDSHYKERSPSKSSRHKSPLNSRSSYRERDNHDFKRKVDTSDAKAKKECIIEVSNVHPDVGKEELEDFFHGFEVCKDTFIRRYTDRGEPTSDIRVNFRNFHSAQKAIKSLNRRYLRGVPISMYIVN